MTTEGFDESAFANTGHAGDADAFGLACLRQQSLQNLLRLCFVRTRVTLDQCDGARQNRAVAREHSGNVVLRREHQGAPRESRLVCATVFVPLHS